jgi:hypothetical protein
VLVWTSDDVPMIKTLSCGGAKFQAWSNAEWKWATTAAIGACRRGDAWDR